MANRDELLLTAERKHVFYFQAHTKTLTDPRAVMAQKPNQGLDESTRSHLAGIAVNGVNRPVEWFEKKRVY